MAPSDKQDSKKHKKEKVLHTRISESLDGEIRDHASRLGISVSNLVRNVLQNTLGLVEDIVTDSANIALSTHKDTRRERTIDPQHGAQDESLEADHEPVILGWQELLLNLNALCDRCNTILPKGTRAAVGISTIPGTKAFRCLSCLKKELSDEPEDAET